MSFEAFKNWYSQSPDSEGIGEAAAVSRVTGIKEFGRLTGLDEVFVDELMEKFRSNIGDHGDGVISREQFDASAQELTALRVRDLSQEDAQRLQTVMGDMLNLFDTNGEGVLDIS